MKGKRVIPFIGSLCLALVLAALLLPACAAEEAPAPTPAPTPKPTPTPTPTPTPKPTPTPTPTPAPGKTYKFTWSWWGPPNHADAAYWHIPIIEEIEKRTNGRVQIEHVSGGALGKAADHYYMVRDGVCDFAAAVVTYTPGLFLLQDVGVLPFAAEDPFKLNQALVELAKMGYFDIEEPYQKVKTLTVGCTTLYGLLFREHRPETVADMKGLKCRTPGGYQSNIVAALGMTPVSVTPPEVYTSLERGVIDIHMHHFTGFKAYKTVEIARAILDLRHTAYSGVFLAMNLDSWNSLTPDLQQIIEEVAKASGYTAAHAKGDADTRAYCAEHNLEIYSLSPVEQEYAKIRTLPVWNQFIADAEAKGLPGKEIVADFVKILRGLGENPPYQP